MPKDSTQLFVIDLDVVLEWLIVILILFSPLIYGSVTILPLSIVEATSFLTLFIFLFGFLFRNQSSLIKFPILPIFFFIILVLFEFLPLPRSLLNFFSPITLTLYQKFRIGLPDRLPLSIYSESTLNSLLQYLSYLSVFFVVLNYTDTKRKRNHLIHSIIICGFIYSLYGLIRRWSTPLPAFSTFTNRNHFAGFIEMIIPLGIIYSFRGPSKIFRFIFAFIALVEVLALFLSLSRAGIASFFLSIIIMLFLLRLKRPIKREIIIVVSIFLILSVFLVGIGLEPMIERLKTLLSPSSAFSDRPKVIKDSLNIIKDFPLFGTGLGTFGEIFQKYKTFGLEYGAAIRYDFAHNELLQLWVETGLLGFLCILWFLLVYFKNIFSLWFKRKNPYAVYVTLGLLVGIFSIILHSLFDFVFHVPANTLLFFVILALAYRVVYAEEPQNLLPLPEYRVILPKSLRIFLICILCLALVFVESLILKRYQAKAIYQQFKEDKILVTDTDDMIKYKKILRDIDKAVTLNPFDSQYVNKKADFLADLALKEDLKDELQYTWPGGQKEVLGLAEECYKKAINLNPTRADYHVRLGWLYSVLGKIDLTEKELKKAISLDPQNMQIQSYAEEYLKKIQELK